MWLGILVAAAFITAVKLVVYPLADDSIARRDRDWRERSWAVRI
jgi:hypothetical protein